MAAGNDNKLNLFSSNHTKAILKAASSGDQSALSAILSNHDVNAKQANGKTLLEHAVKRGDKTALQNLIKAGADVRESKMSLLKASKRGYSESVDVLLRAGAEVNFVDDAGDTSLHLASKGGHLLCLRSLLSNGAKIGAQNRKGQTAFGVACLKGHRSCMVALLESGAYFISPHVKSVSEFASYLQRCAYLLKLERKINTKDGAGMTLLMYAASSLSEKCVKYLLNCGSDANILNEYGSTALMFVFCGFYYLSELTFLNWEVPVSINFLKLLAGIKKNHKDEYRMTALMYAMASKRLLDDTLISFLAEGCVDCVSAFQKTALMYAIENGRELSENAIKCLRGNTLDHENREGETALMLAGDRLPTRHLLLLLGTHVNARDNMGRHALFYVKHNVELIEEYVHHGMDVNLQDWDGTTALMDALAHNRKLTEDVVQILVGDTVTVTDRAGRSALMFARTAIHIGKLLETGFDVNLQDVHGRTPLMHGIMSRVQPSALELLVGRDVNVRDKQGRTALMYAVASQSIDLVKVIIGHGGDLNVRDTDGRTALMLAASFFDSLTRDVFELLCGDSINTRDKFENSAFLHVALAGRMTPETCQHLLELGASVNIRDNNNKTDLLKLTEPKSDRPFVQYYPWNNCFRFAHNRKSAADKIICVNNSPFIHDVLKPHLKPTSFNLAQALQDSYVLRFLVCNSILPYFLDDDYSLRSTFSPISLALRLSNTNAARYLIANNVFIDRDFQRLQELLRSDHQLSEEAKLLTQQAVSFPWPLVTLAFIKVSTLIGHSIKRSDNITQLKLPKTFEDMLLFKRPASGIPTSDWGRIPLSFDPEVYEDLPQPRPLLYQWPVGRDLLNWLNRAMPTDKYPLRK